MDSSDAIKPRIEEMQKPIRNLLDSLNQVILDKESLVLDLVTGVLAGGHVLLEGLPGLGKTELVKGFSRLCSIGFNRVQFTPDLLPSDITGSFILQQKEGQREFVFQEGPVFTNVLLGDEINRASPKTQSALLEAMQERSVTVMGETRALPSPFFVIATQNPIELEGTYPLPEAQVDRFLFKLHLTRPASRVLSDIVRDRVNGAPPTLEPVLTLDQLRAAIALVHDIYVSEAVSNYIARLVEATHPDSPDAPESVRKYVRYGGSPRAAIALGASARARSLILGRPQAGFDSVRDLFGAVMNHRLILDYSARIDGVGVDRAMADVLSAVDEYSKPLPAGVKE
ncbi:AAA family ATPase [Candidatus Sumerlaeota bacterium]|nr:AAA family ATPase [Candidatus Sumerlaeota bacterium]